MISMTSFGGGMSIELEPPIAGPDGKPRQRKVRPARAKAQPEEKATAGNGAAPGDVAEGDGAAADGDFSESAPEPDAAKPPRPSVGKQETSGSCKMTTKGLVWRDPDDDEKPPIVVAGQFEIIAESRDDFGFNWGILLRWKDPDGKSREWAMPKSLLAGDGIEVRRALLDGGLYVAAGGKARNLLNSYLASIHTKARAKAVTSTGWFGKTFVFPDCAIGRENGDRVILQLPNFVDHAYNVRGTLEEWQTNIARFAEGNSRLALAISTAFAAAIAGPCGAESGGIHFRGRSSVGKTTALNVAGSVWGGGDRGFIRSWRATANGLEATAATHSDALLCLDEISQLSGKEAGEVAYMLGNGLGKSRASRDASLRKPASWRLLFLSTGEISLADKMAEDARNRRQTAGQQVRIIDLPSDTGNHGLFDNLHGFESAARLADHLRSASSRFYGTPIRKFIEAIAPELDNIAVSIKGSVQQFVGDNCPGDDCDGQVKRGCARFGLIGVAGELVTSLDILPWSPREALQAAGACFRAWVEARGGIEPSEEREGIAAVRAFLSAHGFSRFLPAWEQAAGADPKIINLAGYRKRSVDEQDGWDYFITTEAWAEIAAGFSKKSLAETLVKRGFLIPEDERHRSKSERIPEIGRRRVYHVSHKIFSGGGND
jgi:uncharacterized protein (DUF927 family)